MASVPRPDAGVADDGAAQGRDVVRVVRGVLGQAQGAQLGEGEVHLGGRFRARGELEDDADAVERLLLAGADDVVGRRNEADGAVRGGHAEAGADLPLGRLRQPVAVHEDRAAGHGVARVDVLADRVLQEPGRGEDRNALLGTGRQDTARAAEVVGVRVRVEERGDGPVTAMLPVQREPGGGRLHAQEGVDDDHPALALDKGHVRQVQAPDLVDALPDLVQALPGAELPLPPQAGVRGVRAVP